MRVDSTWVEYDLPIDSWTVLLPPTFQQRNDYGCFDDLRDPGFFTRDWRDVCISMIPIDRVDAYVFGQDWDCDAELADRTDCVFYEEVEGDSVAINGRVAEREWGLRTGSIEHRSDVPEVVLRLPISPDSVAVLHIRHVRSFRDTTLARTVAATLTRAGSSGS